MEGRDGKADLRTQTGWRDLVTSLVRILSLSLLVGGHLAALDLLGVDYDQSDKREHFLVGASTSAISLLLIERYEPEMRWYNKLLISTASAALVGIAKETADSFDPGHHSAEKDDVIATVTGGLVVSLSCSWSL